MYPKSRGLVLPAVFTLMLAGCGGLEEDAEDLEVGQAEYAFKHGPGPGPPYNYFLTSYGGPSDSTAYKHKPACYGFSALGSFRYKVVDGTWYYATGAYTFGCGSRLKLEANGKCVVVVVADNGPASWVESKAKNKCGGTGYIIDASPKVSKYLYNKSSAGWSDCLKIKVTEVSGSTSTGPTSCGGGSSGGGGNWYGESCSANSQCQSGQCFINASPGFPDGMCSNFCTDLCPEAAGETSTFCISYDGSNGYCHAKCNYSDFPATGCRSGYSCVTKPRHNQPSVTAQVCIPDQVAGDGSGSGNGWIGDSCSTNSQCEHSYCLAESTFSFPDGMCTKSCSKLCPDKAGETTTFCISYDGSEGFCHPRCNYDKHPQTGCRPSYTCKKMPRFNQSSVERNVCIPEGKADMIGEEPDAEGDLPNPENMDSLEVGCALSAQGSAGGLHGLHGLPGLLLILLVFLAAARRRG